MPKLEWAILALTGALSVPLFLARGQAPRVGAVVDITFTAMPMDREHLHCALSKQIGDHRCERRDPATPWVPPPSGRELLQPFVSTDQFVYLMGGLFDDPAVQAAVQHRRPDSRFTATCKSRLLDSVTDADLRFDAPEWQHADGPLFVAEVLSCRVE